MKKINSKRAICLFIILFLVTVICFSYNHANSSQFEKKPKPKRMSAGAFALIKKAFEGIDSTKLIDYHVHVVGTGTGNTGNFVNKKMLSDKYPAKHEKFKIYLNAARVKNIDKVDQQYIEQLIRLIKKTPHHGKYSLLAFDKNYNYDGTENLNKTEFYVSNEYVFSLAKKYPDYFIPVISVHPYRRDAITELTKYALQGGKIVKWLPNAMGIDPSDKKCDEFYKKMKEFKLVLLSHAGYEQAVDAKDDQRFGNPLLLRKPLDMGVKVIIAHCASLGKSVDLDDPQKKLVNNFTLFIRMMDNQKYKGLLFADISALTQFNRSGKPLKTILGRSELHSRLVNGSDYPLPAVNLVIHLNSLVESGYITNKESIYLREIFTYNPLLFDFVLKRTLKEPKTKKHLSPSIFMRNTDLEYK